MSIQKVTCLFALLAALTAGMWAQGDATLVGTVADQSSAVQPNATVTATDTSSGRQYTGLTDDRGSYRILNMQPGVYRVRAEQMGFAPTVAERIELLVGQTVTLPFVLKLASVQQSVEITAEAPLLNTQTQDVGGNIDRRQMDQLPLLGRNWLDLSMLVKGVTANDVSGNRPGVTRDDQFQLNLDGQQITQNLSTSGGFGQMRISRDAIAEYQLVNSQFDISQGRSVGTQVQAITKSGTNDLHGSFYGNFRRDAFNASDFVTHTVLPYSDTQLGATFGGPIVKDKLHYFGAYEHESEPNTIVAAPPSYGLAPGAGIPFASVNTQYSILARGDYTASAADHISVRGTFWNFANPFANITSLSYPAAAQQSHRYSETVVGTWSHVFTPNLVAKVTAGYFKYFFKYTFAQGIGATPRYIFPGITIGPGFNYPEDFYQRHPQVSPEVSWHHEKHDFKFGADILARVDGGFWPLNSRGSVSFSTAPSAAELNRRFPLSDWNNAAAWDLSGLDATATNVTQSIYRSATIYVPRPTYGVYLGDTWHPLQNLTLNLGIRWDADLGQYDVPGIHPTSILVTNNFDPPNLQAGYRSGVKALNDWAPRFGFSWAAPHGWVVRGGIGMFYGVNESQLALGPATSNGGQTVLGNTILNDGLPDFVGTAYAPGWNRGITDAQYLSGAVPTPPQGLTTFAPNIDDPRVLQASGGFQKQLGNSMSFDSDFVFFKGTHLANSRDVNSFFDPASGYPLNPNPPGAKVPIRPNPAYAGITYFETNLISEYMAVASSFTKRFSRRWQASITDTIMIKNNDDGSGGLATQGFSEIANINNYFCSSCSWGRGVGFQRNTFRFNGVYQGPLGLNLSGIVYLGTGSYWDNNYPSVSGIYALQAGQFGDNLFIAPYAGNKPVTIPSGVLDRWNGAASYPVGSTLPRDALKGKPLYKTDIRLSKDFKFRERAQFTPMIEMFNVFNHPNYGSYQTNILLPSFGTPTQNSAISYVPRELQFAFRASF